VIPPTPTDRRNRSLPPNLFAANGTPIKTYGYRLACLNLGFPREIKALFLIAEVTKPIIGADILYLNNLTIDLRGKRLIDAHSNSSVPGIVRPSAMVLPQVFASTIIPNETEFQRILKEFPELTEPMTYGKPIKHHVVHRIETIGQPTYARARRLAPERLPFAVREFEYMEELGIVRGIKKQLVISFTHGTQGHHGLEALC
jgi:hypothetical protein